MTVVSRTSTAAISSTFRMALILGLGPAVQVHLVKGADVNGRDERGQTPLILAASRGHLAICALLLEAGANPVLTDDMGIDALQTAMRAGRQEVVDLLRHKLDEAQALAAEIPGASSEYDLAEWQPEIEPIPPEADLTVLADVQAIHNAFSMHVPIDLDEDWSDVDIDLPALLPRRTRWRSEAETRWLAGARELLAIGLRDGAIAESLIEYVGAIDGASEHLLSGDGPAMLRIVAGDLGIRITEHAGPLDGEPLANDELEGDTETVLDEAIGFLRSLIAPGSDPLDPYFKMLSRAKPLSREEERSVAEAMERGLLRALTAATGCRAVMTQFLTILRDIEAGTAVWHDFLTDDPAYGEPSNGEESEASENIEQKETADAHEIGAGMYDVPPLLVQRLAIIRNLCGQLDRDLDSADAVRAELAGCLLALGLRPEIFERIRCSIEHQATSDISIEFGAGMEEARNARLQLFKSNQRLVLWMARKYRGLPLSDLIQEGNLGLLKAIDKFDPKRGYKFSTYAMWWVRQAITRAIDDQGQLIRIPVHLATTLRKLTRVSEAYERQFGRLPTPIELSERLALEEHHVIRALNYLDLGVDSLETESHCADHSPVNLPDESNPNPEQIAAVNSVAEAVRAQVASLPERQKNIICLRFGIAMETDHTLEEIGQMYGVTRERIRQIEVKALRRLERRTRSLRDVL